MFNAKNTGATEKLRAKSPKGGAAPSINFERANSEIDDKDVKLFRTQSVLKEGERESTLYGPSNENAKRLLSIRGRPSELMEPVDEEAEVKYGLVNSSYREGSRMSSKELLLQAKQAQGVYDQSSSEESDDYGSHKLKDLSDGERDSNDSL